MISAPSIRAPRLPPVLAKPPVVPATTLVATLDSVDSLTTPTRASFVVNSSLPALSGFVWNSALAVTVAMAPNPAAAPPVGTVYYNNSTTHTGGTIFVIDTKSYTVISATSNFSTVAGVDYSKLFQDIVHNGAFNALGNFQNPNPLDVTSFLGNPSLTTAPVLVAPYPASYGFIYVGANGSISTGGAYDAKFSFNTLVTNAPWLAELRIYVAASGSQLDNIANIDHTYAYKTTISPSNTGQYTAWVHGLVSGVPYDIYVAFVDFQGNVSYGRYLETTAANPVVLSAGNMANMGNPGLVTPTVISHGTDTAENGQAGATAFDYLVPTVTLDSLGYSPNQWLAEIELVYVNAQLPNNIMYANTVTVKQSGTYQFVYPQLPVGINSDGTFITYNLGVRYVDYARQASNIRFFDSVGAATLQVGSPTLQTIPAGTTFSVDFIGCTVPPPANNGGGTFAQPMQFNLHISSSVPYVQWLDKIQLLAKERPDGTPDSDQNPGNYVKVGQITGSTYTNPISQNFGPLGNNSVWQLAIQLIDHSGIFTNALPIFLCGIQQTGAYTSPGATNVNFISDSDMDFVYQPLGATASNYWTYSNLDSTRFRVINGAQGANQLSADSHGGSSVASGCAYTDSIQVISGTTYTLSCMTGLYDTGTQFIGIVDLSDKTANNATPAAVYASVSCPNNRGVQQLVTLTWTATFTGPVYIACWFSTIHGTCAWFHPQFELGATATSYKSGTALTEASATLAHGAISIPVQTVINAASQVRVDSVQSGSRLPLPNTSVAVNDVVQDNGVGRGVLSVAPAGGTTGALPYANADTAVPLTYGIGGAANNSLYALGVVNGTTTAGTSVFTVSATQLALPSGGTWAYVCKLYGGFTGLGCAVGSNPSAVYSAPTGTSSFTLTSGGWVGNDIEYGFVGVQFMGGCAGGQTVGATTFTMTLPGVGVHAAPQLFFESYAVRTGN